VKPLFYARGGSLPLNAHLAVGGHGIAHAQTFASVPRGTAFWYVNSNGLVEIAVNSGRADHALDLAIGSEIKILT